MTLLKLSSYLAGKYNNNDYSEQEIAGFLYGLRYCKKINNLDISYMLEYICPALYAKNYTEIDLKMPRLKKRLTRRFIKL